MTIAHRTNRSRVSLALSALVAASMACSWFSPAPTMTPQPTQTPAPSPTPLPAVPPAVIDRLPEPGAEQPPAAPVVVYFDAPMDRASAEAAFTLTAADDGSAADGDFAWSDNDSTLTFTPSQPLAHSRLYQAEIAAGVRNRAGLALNEAYDFTFQTLGDLAVLQVYPGPESAEAAADSVISVAFNRPIVPLTGVADQADLVNPLTFSPELPGTGEWVTTSLYRFRPERPLVGGLTYTVSIAAGLQDTLGTALTSDYVWSFTAALPSIVSTTPAFDAFNVPLATPITTTFNQPMDRASTEAAFALSGPSGLVPGSLRWSDDERSLGFTPDVRLDFGTTYQITFAEGARAAGGEGPAMPPTSSSFTTVLPARLNSIDPGDGGIDVDPYGAVILYFDSPMDVSTLDANVSIEPEATLAYTYWNEVDLTYALSFDLMPGTTYTIALEPGMLDPYGSAAFTERQTLTFTTGDYPPSAQLGASSMVGYYRANGPTAATLTTRNVESVSFNLAAVDAPTFLVFANGVGTTTTPLSFDRNWSVTPGGARNERVITPVPLAAQGTLAPGLYVLQAYPGEQLSEIDQAIVVSNVQLTMKAGLRSGLAWAIDVRTGEAVADLPLTLWTYTGSRLASARTDADGIATFTWDDEIPTYSELIAISDDPQRMAAASSGWSSGFEPWAFNVEQRYEDTPLVAYVTTDRPIYRPGETIEIKGIVRNRDDARYSLSDLDAVSVQIYGPMGESLLTETQPFSDYGSFAMSLPMDVGADLGMYSIVVRRVGASEMEPAIGSAYFNLAEYRKPEFNVTVTPGAADVVVGDTVTATIDARFFFDLPVTGARVEWSVYGDPVGFTPDVPGSFSFTDPDFSRTAITPAGLGLIAQGVATTDDQGRATISFTAPPADAGRNVHYDIQAVVTDSAGDVQVSGRGSVTAHPSQLAAGIAPSSYIVSTNERVSFDVISLDNAGAIAPDQSVAATYERVDWSCAQAVDPVSRQSTWDCDETRTPVGSQTLTTDAQGRAEGTFTPDQAGSYRLIATITDAAGREARAVAYVYAIGDGEIAWRQDPDAKLELATDRREYRPGDTAEVLIPSPLGEGAQALITVERDGVLRHDVIALEGAATTYRLPLTADDAPGVFISVVVVRPGEQPDYRVGLTRILVSAEQQLLTVTATPDRTRARPGEIVHYTIDVRDSSGAPVQAEVEVRVADLAALNLAEPNSEPIDQAFYGAPALGVRTGLSLNVSGDAVPDDVWALGRGGGGGGGGEGLFELASPRSRFKDTAFWSAQAVTDENGSLTIDVTLPDNLTTWRLNARAVTADTRVGSTQLDLVASKTLQIRPITPRFFTAGDRVTLKAVVDNAGSEAVDVSVLLDASGVTLDGPAEQTANVPAGGRVEVAWPVLVEDAEAADLTFSVQGGGQFDGSKPTLGQGDAQLIPIYRYLAPEVVATSGDLAEAGIRVEAIGVPRRFGAVAADLDVRVTPSLMASFTPALDALEDPDEPDRELAIGWAARLSANTAVLRALRTAETQPDLQSVLLGRIQRAVRALNGLQGADGGWGYWIDAPSDEWLTATIVLALTADQRLEEEAALPQVGYMLERAVGYLSGQAFAVSPGDVPADENWRIDQLALTVYALSTTNSDVAVVIDALYEFRDRLSAEGLALLALSLPEDDPRAATLIDTLVSTADVSATGASWPTSDTGYWLFGSQTRATSVVLEALMRHDAENPLAPSVVRWLMIARRADSWETTEETAAALNALSAWAEHTGELKGDFDYTVRLNDAVLLEGAASEATLGDEAEARTDDLIRAQANQLAFERGAGDGRLYYTAALNVVVPAGEAPAVDRGFVVSRSYALESSECGAADQPLCPAITAAGVGDTIRVTVNVSTSRERHFVVLEDLFPAGAEAVDTSLLTAPRSDEPIGLRAVQPDFWWGGWWFGHETVKDDRVRVIAEVLPAGAYTYSYLLYLQTDGVFQVRPAQAYELYAPEVFGRSEGGVFTVTP